MNRLLLLCIALLFLQGACQKEKYKDDNILMTVGAPAESSDGTSIIVKGNILSSGIIDFKDHGFNVTFSPSMVVQYPLGARKGPGPVKTNIPDDLSQIIKVELYGYDKNGKYYSSDVNSSTNSNDLSNYVSISAPACSSSASYNVFTGYITNLDPTNYTILSVGLQYTNLQTSATNTYPIIVNPTTDPVIPINTQIPYSSNTFTNGGSYSCKFYVQMHRNSDSAEQLVYGSEAQFLEQIP